MSHFEGPNSAPTAIDLFAGGGGVTEGLLRAGVDVRYAYETDDMARTTYYHQHCEPNNIVLRGDATDIDHDLQNEIDVIFAGPPCQKFSSNQGETIVDADKNLLPFSVVDWAAIEPEVMVIENVEGMRRHHGMTVDSLIDEISDAGYRVQLLTLNAMKYGVPQSRDRVFFMCIRETADSEATIPEQWQPPVVCNEEQHNLSRFTTDYGADDPDEYVPVKDVIGDLPEPVGPARPSETSLHSTLADRGDVESNRYSRVRVDPLSTRNIVERGGKKVAIPTNHVKRDHSMDARETMAQRKLGRNKQPTTSRRLDPESVAPTITASNDTPPIHWIGQSPSHPERDVADVRRLTVRECARIQGFPDTYTVAGTRGEQTQQIANSVPPQLAFSIAKHIRHNVLGSVYTDETASREITL